MIEDDGSTTDKVPNVSQFNVNDYITVGSTGRVYRIVTLGPLGMAQVNNEEGQQYTMSLFLCRVLTFSEIMQFRYVRLLERQIREDQGPNR